MACGANQSGQLGLGDTDDCDTFTLVSGLCEVLDVDAGYGHTLAVTAEGGLFAWGAGWAIGNGGGEERQCLVPIQVTGGGIKEAGVVQVAAGERHSMALSTSGELYAWGAGGNGQLGHGGKEDLAVPRVVGVIGAVVVGMAGGDKHSLVTTAEGRVLAFGSNGSAWEVLADGEELDEPVVVADGRLGLGPEAEEALIPTAINGIVIGRQGEEGKEGKE